MTDNPYPIFATRPVHWQSKLQMTNAALAKYGDRFATDDGLRQFFQYIVTPRNGAWSFVINGKAGCTSALKFLFLLEFGHPLGVNYTALNNLNSDQIAHEAMAARVFSWLTDRSDVTEVQAWLNGTLRLTTVRHPLARAVSGFRYLCKSNKLGSRQFMTDRLRMNALVGFDWAHHPDTEQGFLRFLEFVRIELEQPKNALLDIHWRPQRMNVRPGIVPPSILGRVEDMPAFYREIAARLDRPLPEAALDMAIANSQSARSDDTLGQSPAAKDLVGRIFAIDFDAFGYQL